MEKNNIKKFNNRAFISVGMFTSGLILPISGIMNHILQFEPLTEARHFYMAIHNMSAVLFVIFIVIHLSYNWVSLMKYSRKIGDIIISKEALAAILLVICIVGIFSMHVFHIS
jgi:hypothetical protein